MLDFLLIRCGWETTPTGFGDRGRPLSKIDTYRRWRRLPRLFR